MPVNQQTLQDLGEERPSMKVMVYDMLKKKKAKAKGNVAYSSVNQGNLTHWNMEHEESEKVAGNDRINGRPEPC